MKEIIVVFCCCAHFINNDVPCRFLHHGKYVQRYIFFYKIVLQKLGTSLFCLRIQIKCFFCCLQKAIKQTGSIDLSINSLLEMKNAVDLTVLKTAKKDGLKVLKNTRRDS